jgi:nucleotide-binding universal stress UspA family protein
MTILMAVDLSAASQKSLDAVRKILPRETVQVILVHVAEPDPAFVGWEAGPDVVRDQVATEFRRERHEVEQMGAQLRADGIDVVALTVQGPTVATILAEAERLNADLIVVGSHGHGAAYDLAVGSTSAGVIRKATVPVLVVPDHR